MKKIILILYANFNSFLLLSFFFCLTSSIISCDLSLCLSYEKVIFHVDRKANTASWEIEKIMYINEDNEVKEIIFDNISNYKTDMETTFSLFLSQNQLTPVLVYYKNQLFPQGTIYPYSTKITFHDGFSSKILFRFLNETQSTNSKLLKKIIASFNWEKFSQKIKSYENPWRLNQELILEGLNSGKITSNYFKILE